MAPSDEPRDFRDAADVDEAIDAIRTCPDRQQARALYLQCLTVAYHQGRMEATGELIKKVLR